MRIDMTPILSGRTEIVPFSFDWEGASEIFSEFSFEGPVKVEGKVTERAGCMLLTLSATVSYRTECARCLKELHRTLVFDLSKNVAVEGTLEDEERDDYVMIVDSELDLSLPLSELLFLELPGRDLCREDCLGLCPKCGKDRNEGECGCVTKEIDPRLAVLQKYLNNNEENL